MHGGALPPNASSASAPRPVEEVPWDWIDRGWEERRAHVRKSIVLPAKLETADRQFDCLILDISAGGARLHMSQDISQDFDAAQSVTLTFEGYGTFAARVAWRATAEIGLKFAAAPDAVAKALAEIL
jgi:hypothetical protein